MRAQGKGWLVGAVVVLLVSSPALIAAIESPYCVGRPQIESLGHAVDVAIAICVGYMALDRFRYQKRMAELAADLGLDAYRDLIVRQFRNGIRDGDAEACLNLYYFAEDKVVVPGVQGKIAVLAESDFYKSWRGSSLRWLLKGRVDRKIIIILLLVLGLWQIISAAILLNPSLACLHSWKTRGLFFSSNTPWVVLSLIALSFAASTVSWLQGEITFSSIRKSAKNWAKGLAQTENNAASVLMP